MVFRVGVSHSTLPSHRSPASGDINVFNLSRDPADIWVETPQSVS